MKKYRNNTLAYKNLESALANEATCHVKYTLWGDSAEKDGYPEIAHCYRVAAKNELAHADLWMRELGLMGSINENLQNAATMEKSGALSYVNFAADAENEGHDGLRDKFLCTSKAEEAHFNEFSNMHNRFISGEMFVSPDCNTCWVCYNCGYSAQGETPPEHCPLCGRPETWFVPQG